MTMLTHSEVEIDFDFDPCVVADQLCRGVQPAEEMEACRGCNFRRAYWESCVSKELASVICFATTGFVSRFRPCVRNRLVFRLGGMLGRECSTQHVVYG